MEYIIAGTVILIGNLFSGKPGSLRWGKVTALFGWGAAFSLTLWLVLLVSGFESWANEILIPVFGFCLIQALTRDYERILRPVADLWLRRRDVKNKGSDE